MIRLKEFYPTRKPNQSAHDYYEIKKIIWGLRKQINNYHKELLNRYPEVNVTIYDNPWTIKKSTNISTQSL
jgi:hypothetical protein